MADATTISLQEATRAVGRGVSVRPGLMVLPWVGCLLVALAVHFAVPLMVNEYYANLLRRVGVFIIAAVSLNIVNGFTGQFSMGHAGFMALGAYVASAVTYYGSMYFHGSVGDAAFAGQGLALMLLGLALAGAVAAGAGYLVGLPSLRLRGDYLAIVTLGFGEIIRVLLELTRDQVYDAQVVQGAPWATLLSFPLNGAKGFERIPAYATLFWVYLFVAITCVVAYRIKQSSSGRAFLSIREDEIAARSMGVDLARYKVRAFVLAAVLGGLAGGLYAHIGVNPSPTDAGFQRSFEIVIMVVLGGLGSISGSVLAAIILVAMPELLRDFAQYRLVVYALLLILMMLLRPQGLFGVREVWEVKLWSRRGGAGGKGAGA
jgi:branched-chain amino acid transport system permease protein